MSSRRRRVPAATLMYLNVIQLAESFGVAESVVEGWVRNESLPCVRDRGRLMFDRGQVVQWAAQRGFAAKAGFLAPEVAASAAAGRLEKWLRAGGIWRQVAPDAVRDIVVRAVEAVPGVTPAVRELLKQRVQGPGGITWAPVGNGLALPHLRSHVALGRESGVLALIFLNGAIAMDGEEPPDGVGVTRLFFFMAPSPRAHLELLAQLSRAMTRGALRQPIFDEAGDEVIFAALAAAEQGADPKGVSS